jgi:hypothetical protein
MEIENLTKAYHSCGFLLADLRAAQKENPAHATMIFSLVEEALKLETQLYATLSAAVQARTAVKMKGHQNENHS